MTKVSELFGMTEYNLHWRNVIIEDVDWVNELLFYKFIHEKQDKYVHMCDFQKIKLPHHSDELQCVKMIMDRHIVENFERGCCDKCTTDYVKDIFKHPYEWETVLFKEEV